MNHVFHYHVTAYLALQAGYSPEVARTIAQASRMVDRQFFSLNVTCKGRPYKLSPTHHYGLMTSGQDAAIWKPFHFFPSGLQRPVVSEAADSAPFRAEYQTLWTPWCTSPKADPVKDVLVGALRSGNPYRIGIALHVFADSWAHQGFCGAPAPINNIPGVLGLPDIGHAQVESRPDIFNLVWQDRRREHPTVRNKVRFLEAARYVYRYLCTANRQAFDHERQVLAELEDICQSDKPPQDHADVTKGVSKVIRKGAETLRELQDISGVKLGGRDFPVLDEDQVALHGASDQELVTALSARLPFPDSSPDEWLESVLLVPDNQRSVLKIGVDDINSRLFWVKTQVMKLGLFNNEAIEARGNFFESELYCFNEAAKEHLAYCQQIFKNI